MNLYVDMCKKDGKEQYRNLPILTSAAFIGVIQKEQLEAGYGQRSVREDICVGFSFLPEDCPYVNLHGEGGSVDTQPGHRQLWHQSFIQATSAINTKPNVPLGFVDDVVAGRPIREPPTPPTRMTNDQRHQTLLLYRQMQRCIGYCSDVIPRCIPEKGVAWETLFDGIIENKKREPSVLSAAP